MPSPTAQIRNCELLRISSVVESDRRAAVCIAIGGSMVIMQRMITGFRQDEVGDWVADLACLHAQHVRHRPPLLPRPWVETAAGRGEHLATMIDCPLCDRAEIPDGLEVARTVGPFDETTLPAGLRRDHRVADATWGRLHVLAGSARFTMAVEPPIDVDLLAGDSQPIPPGVLHTVVLTNGSIEVDFLIAVRR